MKNEFYVTACRFHVKDRNKLLIQGWFQDNEFGKNVLSVYLDEQKLEYEVEQFTDIAEAHKCVNGRPVVKNRYYLWIPLPENWRSCEKLKVVNEYNSEKKVFFTVSKSKLEKIENRMDKFVDGGSVDKDGFKVVGWYVSAEPVKIKIYTENGKLLESEVKERRRGDVKRQYPECTDQEVHGFVAECHTEIPKRIRIHMENSRCESDYELLLKPSKIKKGIQKLKKNGFKAYVYYQQFGLKQTAERMLVKLTKQDSITYKNWLRIHQPNEKALEEQRKKHFAYEPKISIVVPLYKTPEKYLAEMIDSVKKQTYSNWELCLSDGSGKNSPIIEKLKKYEKEDSRIRVVYTGKQMHISENTNEALKIATGDFIAFGDHDDLLAPNAFYECVRVFNEEPDTEAVYTDEDKVTMDAKEYFQPHFKPDFNLDMLRSENYICHLFVVKRSLFKKVGFLNHEFDGAQDFDFVLRCSEKTDKIRHIPMVLYHWRAHKDSTAENPESKRYAFEAGARVVQAHYKRVGIDAEVSMGEVNGIYRTKYNLKETPLVSIIIPNKDHVADLDKCIQAIEKKATYKNIEYIIVENNSEEQATFDYYEKLKQNNKKVKVVVWEKKFNYSAINNFGVKFASGEYLLFLNNDTEIINSDCIEELLGHCMRDDVGIVGARLYYEDDTIQHAGVIIGLGGVAGHAFPGACKEEPGYFGRIIAAQDYSAVTAACMMTKKSVFNEVQGFEEKLAVAFNDVDFCMKVREAGYLVVYNPYAELHHYESKSRGLEDTEEKVQRFQGEIETFKERWGEFLLKGDPYYSPNLTLDKNDFSLRV